jgi:beta-lactamase class A
MRRRYFRPGSVAGESSSDYRDIVMNADAHTTHGLRSEVLSEIGRTEGIFAVAFREISRPGTGLLINEHEPFHAASLMKICVMIEVYRQVADRKFSLDDTICVRNEFTSIADGSTFSLQMHRDGGDTLYHMIGSEVTVRELMLDMITVSGNLSTNLLIELVGTKNINTTMRKLGAKNLCVLRGVEDMRAFERGLNNIVTAHDMLAILEKLACGTIISKSYSEEMLSIMLRQRYNDIIPSRLPLRVKIAHKTGSISGVRHDVGIVCLPDGRIYVLVLLSKSLSDESDGEKTLRNLSKIFYDYLQ